MKYYNDDNKLRRLKVEEVGDFYRHRTKPFLRLTGMWLKAAGINPNTYVLVINPEPGILVITLDLRKSG
jgi:hypothetical protein